MRNLRNGIRGSPRKRLSAKNLANEGSRRRKRNFFSIIKLMRRGKGGLLDGFWGQSMRQTKRDKRMGEEKQRGRQKNWLANFPNCQ
jgi:hypothetical protein